MPINYDYYRIFYTVVACGNITSASQELFLSQSTVSRTIQNLESSLGCQLLYRSTHGIKLTREGDILFRHVKPAVEHIQMAEERLGNIRTLKEGVLHIGVSELTLDQFILPYLQEMKGQYPKITIRLSLVAPNEAVEKLKADLLDLAVMGTPLPSDSSICVMPIPNTKDVVFQILSGEAFPELQGEPQDLATLIDNYPLICFKRGTSVRTYADELAASVGRSIVPACEVDNSYLLMPMLQAGLGLGFIHTSAPIVRRKGLFEVKLKQRTEIGHICLLTNSAYRSSASDCFINLLFAGSIKSH
jgi:DNA-binding transcriptional LysR family regulator